MNTEDLRSESRARPSASNPMEPSMDENAHPKGALVFILIFLLVLVAFWFNTYMQLWLRY